MEIANKIKIIITNTKNDKTVQQRKQNNTKQNNYK